jgi:hypothetical protein
MGIKSNGEARKVYPVRLSSVEIQQLERCAESAGQKNGAAMIREWIRIHNAKAFQQGRQRTPPPNP